MITEQLDIPKRKGRGLGVKPRLACTSIRLEAEVLEFYRRNYGSKMQSKMREVLREYVNKNHTTKE